MKIDENWCDDPIRDRREYWLRTPPSPTGQQVVRGSFHGRLPPGWIRSILPIPDPVPPPLPEARAK